MMAEPLVSILIPCYNAERWVARTLEAALAQTWPRKEIIVVNNSSTDGSLEILKQYESAQVLVVTKENRGASAARNRAYSESQGEFIQYLDADDLLASDKIELQMRRLMAARPEHVAAGAWGRFHHSIDEAVFVREPVWADMGAIDWLVTAWSGGWMMASHAWLTPRSVIEKAGGWDETPSPNDDGEFFARVLMHSQGVLFCTEARAYYRSGIPGSSSKIKSPEMLAAIYRSIEQSTGCLLELEDSARTRRACAAYFQRFIYDTYPESPRLVRLAEERVEALGGSDYPLPVGGRLHRLAVQTLNWKNAKRIQRLYRKMR
jgi:glycosyltransferase involved in cell wall biosynthesis